MAPGIQRDEWRNRRRHIDFTDVGNLPEFVSESRHRSGYERRFWPCCEVRRSSETVCLSVNTGKCAFDRFR
jgi:hypothetical protein